MLSSLKEKFYRIWYGKKGNNKWQEIFQTLGNPGIWFYVKKKHYPEALEYLEKSDHYHDLEKTNGKILEITFSEFEFKDEVTECDFSHEPFKDDDILIPIWKVNKNISNNYE